MEPDDRTRWIVTRELDADHACRQDGMLTAAGRPVAIGREADLALGVAFEDAGVSRVALTVTAGPHGWEVESLNRNGAVLHPWGLGPALAARRTVLDWPLVAVRVVGSDNDLQHWVLLQAQSRPGEAHRPVALAGTTTLRAAPPRPLTPAEAEALWTVFVETLAWPPRQPAQPLQLKQAARRLHVTESAVQLRLEGAQRKALALGLTRPVRLTEPDYLYVLVGAGYLTPPRLSAVPVALRSE